MSWFAVRKARNDSRRGTVEGMNFQKNGLSTVLSVMGVLHFVKAQTFESIVPPQLPGPARFYNFASGLWEIVTGALLRRRATRGFGGASALALFAAVWPANMYHAWIERKAGWPKKIYHIIRQPLQVLLMMYAWNIAKHEA